MHPDLRRQTRPNMTLDGQYSAQPEFNPGIAGLKASVAGTPLDLTWFQETAQKGGPSKSQY
jgi:hypothetical protein